LYPLLDDVEFESEWEGLFATTPDSLPYIGPHRRYPRHLFALGYGGNGITYSALAGEIIRDLFLERPNPDAGLFCFDR